jgi:hypothetical protein
MYHALLTLILTLPIPAAPNPAGELLRLGDVAQALDAASAEQQPGPLSHNRLAALGLAVWWHESRLAYRVHAGGANGWGSDHGRATCLGQLHDTGLLEPGEWPTLAGTDYGSTLSCARATVRVLQRFARWCRYDGSDESVARVLGAYGTGQGCIAHPDSRARAVTARKFWRQL